MTRTHLSFLLYAAGVTVILAAAAGLAGWWDMPPGANALAIPMVVLISLAGRLRAPGPLDMTAQFIIAPLFGLSAAFSTKAAFATTLPLTVLTGLSATLAYAALVRFAANLPVHPRNQPTP